MVEQEIQDLKLLKVDLVVVVVEQLLQVHNPQLMELLLQPQAEQVQPQVLMELQQQELVVVVVALMLVDQ
tara:strand:- start:40 stop:249 length:210 start_codon:yes stop_codon:yes gene_type:complete